MNAENHKPESILDEALAAIRQEPIEPAAAEQAAGRVWNRLRQEAEPPEVETIRDCADFQTLIPAFVAGRLTAARALLLEDHTHECPRCRKALADARSGKVLPLRPARPKPAPSPWRAAWQWGLAAASVAALTLGGVWAVNRYTASPVGPAVVQAADGALYKLASDSAAPLGAGSTVEERQMVRAAAGAGAVLRLADGSLIEMRERTELSLAHRRDGTTIRLERGNVIIQAAKQGSRRLYVATDDCLVTVTGTIFSVSRGVKGSRVAVIEGQVKVDQGGSTSVVRAGEQVSTSPALAPLALNEEVAWSRNRDNYFALLRDLSAVRQKLEAAPGPGLRYSTKLLDLAPEGTLVYVAIPNLGPTLIEARHLIEEQARQSEALRQWWTEKMKSAGGEAQFDEMFARVRSFSEYLGPEIAVALTAVRGKEMAPVVLAELSKPGFRAYLESEMAKLGPKGSQAPLRFVEDPAPLAGAGGKGLVVLLRGQIAAISPEPALAARVGAGAFAKTAFRARIAEAYRGGLTWVVAADLQSVLERSAAEPKKKSPDETLRFAGIDDVRYVVAVRKEVAGKSENRATLAFAGPRHGVASWLAPPAPMRAPDFISPEATFAAAFLVKNPSLIVAELFRMLGGSRPNFERELAAAETLVGVNVREDLIRPLGGEIALALDGPALPQPSWKLVVEVNDPARLQQGLEKLLETFGRYAPKDAPRLEKEPAGGRTYYALRGLKQVPECHYVFADGYLVAAPSRALLDRAIRNREAGYSLPRSAKFASLLPRDQHANFSAMVYHALGNLLAPLAQGLKGMQGLTPEQRQTVEGAAAAATPSLVLIYDESDRLELAGAGGLFGFNWENLLASSPPRRKR